MSQAQIEQFSSRVKNDPAMFNQLVAGTQTPDEFIDKAVALGAQSGFSFTRAEADGWIKTQIEAKANGELSDLQLEGVAGGKMGDMTKKFAKDNNIMTQGTVQDGIRLVGVALTDFFTSW